jgi:hypothetical protein
MEESMDPKIRPAQTETNSTKPASKKKTEIEHDLWTRRGIEDVFFQRGNMVNFWTVMGGIAAGALLTQLAPLEENILSSRWYLVFYFISSILIIVSHWVQSAWGSLVLRWPMTVLGTLIYFLSLFSLGVQSLYVTKPAAWMAVSTAIVFFAILNQFYFIKTGAWVGFSTETIKRLHGNIRVYFFFLFICLLGVIQLAWFTSPLAELFWGLVALASSILSLVMQHNGMLQEKKELGIP